MSKTKEQLLFDFMKSNKERRLKIAIKAGYSTSEDYIKYLKGIETVIVTKKVSKKRGKPTIHIIDIIDCSGSMFGAKINNAIKGINNGILELKKDTSVNYTYTLCDFSGSNDIQYKYVKAPLNTVETVNFRDRGMTALYDAIGKTLTTASKNIKKDEKVLVNIYTDGEENGSRSFDSKKVSELIEDLKKDYTVTFIGTDVDVKSVITKLKIDETNTLAYDGSGKGLEKSMSLNNLARSAYSSSVKEGKDVSVGFFKNIVKK